MNKATADQLDLFSAALEGAGCTFKISGKGNLNVIGGDRETVTAAATELGFFVVHISAAGEAGKVVGYDAKGFNADGLDRDGYNTKGLDWRGLTRDGLTAAEQKKAPRTLTSTPELLRSEDGVVVTKEGRRLYFVIPYGHQMTSVVKNAGGHWEPATKRWWIAAAGNDSLIKTLDEMAELNRDKAARDAERKAAQIARDAERKVAEEAAKAHDLASRTWVSIPFEAADIREAAKASGAKWDPATKRWGLRPETAGAVTAKLDALESSRQEAQAKQDALAPIKLQDFNSEPYAYRAGEVIWARMPDVAGLPPEGAFVKIVTVKSVWNRGDDGIGQPEDGYFHYLAARLATDEESAELREKRAAHLATRQALAAYDKARSQATAPAEVAPAAEGSIEYVQDRTLYGFEEAAIVEPEGTPDRRIIFTSYRGGDGDMWHDGNFGRANTTARPVPYNTDLDDAVKAVAKRNEKNQ